MLSTWRSKLSELFRHNQQAGWLAIASLLFLIFFSLLVTPIATNTQLAPRFDWPDSTANYFWIKQYANHNQLTLPEPLNLNTHNLIHPRSFNVNAQGELVPGSFLGLILFFGWLAKIFSTRAIIYFTPFLAVSAAWALYLLVKKIFSSPGAAFWSALLLLLAPVWDYYTFESLLPNVPFLAVFLWSAWSITSIKKDKLLTWLLAGLLCGLTLSLRPSEVVWMTIIYLPLLISQANYKNWKGWLLLIGGIILALAPSLYEQKLIYGQALSVGYNQLASASSSLTLRHLVKQLLLPFGLDPARAWHNFSRYFLALNWPFLVLAILGIFSLPKKPRLINLYLIISSVIFIYLIFYYGSWRFDDQLNLILNNLGASYVRYWLILLVLLLPLAGLFLDRLGRLKYQISLSCLPWLIISLLAIWSLNLTLFQDPNNILSVRQKIADYKLQAEPLINQTEDNAIIVTTRTDKWFFPERRVIHTFNLTADQQLLTILDHLKTQAPVYIFDVKTGLKKY
jgi:hypothetical protein